jgi:hypothetical protein
MQLMLMAGFVLAFGAASEDPQNTPPKSDTETMCVPNRAPQNGTRRGATRKPTVQCNLVNDDRNRDRRLRGIDRDPVPARASYETRPDFAQ